MKNISPSVVDLDDRVLGRPETRQMLGNISERTEWRLKEAGDYPPATQISPGRVGYRLSDIRAWLDARRRGSWQQIGTVAQRVVESCGADIRDHQRKMQAELNRQKED
jgi:predicted DNA-binding transcriptional regulator AlpA